MSTRCNIIVKNKTEQAILYHHHDGYPEGVGVALLTKVTPLLKDNRYYNDVEDIVNALIKDKDDDEYEYTAALHGDIEYLYEIDTDAKTIKCFAYDYMTATKGDEISLNRFWVVTRSDQGSRDSWYLSKPDGSIYTDDDGNTIYFTSNVDASEKAYELNYEK